MTLNQHIKQFLEYLEIEKGRSQRTCRNYEFYLKRFADWAKDPSPDKITTPVIKNYRLWLNRLTDAKNQSLKKNTQNYHLIALRSFLKYLAKNDVKTLASEKIELAKTPERTVEFLEGSDLERLLEAPQRIDNPDIIKKRDKAILELLFSTGLRVSELTSLTKDSLNLQKDEFTIRGKGDKPRIVFLSNQSKFWIRQYLEARKDMDPALFVSHDRAKKGRPNEKTANPLTPRSIQRLVKKYSKAAGITKDITTHTLRHSYATDLLINGADIRSVQAMLGHASITTTQIYTHITNQQLRDVHKAFHGRKRKQQESKGSTGEKKE